MNRKIGVYICHCGSNIAGTVDVSAVTDFARGLPSVAVARDYKYMCSDPGLNMIKEAIKEKNLTGVVVAAAIAKSGYFETCWAAMRVGFPLFVLPFYFLYHPALIELQWTTVIYFLTGSISLIVICFFLLSPGRGLWVIVSIAGALAGTGLIYWSFGVPFFVSLAVAALVLTLQFRKSLNEARARGLIG